MVRLGGRRWSCCWQFIGRNDGELAFNVERILMWFKRWGYWRTAEQLTRPTDGQLDHGLLLPSVLVFAGHLQWCRHCHSVTSLSTSSQKKFKGTYIFHRVNYKSKIVLLLIIIIIVLTVHPLAVVIETRTPFVHFDFLGEHFGVTWSCEEIHIHIMWCKISSKSLQQCIC